MLVLRGGVALDQRGDRELRDAAAFEQPEPPGQPAALLMPPHWVWWGFAGLAIATAVLLLGQMVFRRLEGRFAQEL